MKINEILTEAVKQRLDAKCWSGYHKAGTKIKGGVRVNNCVANENEGDCEGLPHLTPELANHIADQIDSEGSHAIVKSVEWGDGAADELTRYIQQSLRDFEEEIDETAAWRRKEGKNKNGGLNAKGVASYRKEHPGSKLKTAVTKKPSELKPGSKDAKRRKSFCARMSGVDGPMKKPNGEPTRKALALRKWNC